jgi:hypothetical protein
MIIHMILTSMLCIGIGGSMCYVLFHGIEEQKRRETRISTPKARSPSPKGEGGIAL